MVVFVLTRLDQLERLQLLGWKILVAFVTEQWFLRERKAHGVDGILFFILLGLSSRIVAGDFCKVTLGEVHGRLSDGDESDFWVNGVGTWHQLHGRIPMAQENLRGCPLALFIDLNAVAWLRIEASGLNGNVCRHIRLSTASTEGSHGCGTTRLDTLAHRAKNPIRLAGQSVVLALSIERS